MKARGPFVLGLIAGLLGGLLYARLINPVRYTNAYPALLPREVRAEWIRMSAFAYAYDGDPVRAAVRLANLPPEEIAAGLAQALNDAVAQALPTEQLKRIAHLAAHYGVDNPTVAIYTRPALAPTPAPPIPSPSLSPSPSPTPTLLPTPTPALTTTLPLTLSILPTPNPHLSPYVISATMQECEETPLVAITVTQLITVGQGRRAHRESVGLPGLTLWLLWDGGADRAVTGFAPHHGEGYTDFELSEEATYNLYLDRPTGAPILTLAIEPCTTENGERGWTSWRIWIRKGARPPITPTPTLAPTVTLTPTPTVTITVTP